MAEASKYFGQASGLGGGDKRDVSGESPQDRHAQGRSKRSKRHHKRSSKRSSR